MAAADLAHVPDPKTVMEDTADDVIHFMEILAEWLIPTIGIIIGLFIGPKIFSGTVIGDALYNQGWKTPYPATQVSYAYLVGILAGAGVIGMAAASLWSYQKGRKGWSAIVSRLIGGFGIGWAIGILVGGLNAFFVTGNASAGAPFQSWLDTNINNAIIVPRVPGATPEPGPT